MIVDAGFSGVNRRPLSGGVAQLVTATRTGHPPSGRRRGTPGAKVGDR
jgi:hypothetical protein